MLTGSLRGFDSILVTLWMAVVAQVLFRAQFLYHARDSKKAARLTVGSGLSSEGTVRQVDRQTHFYPGDFSLL